jgi:hypothetical protein
MRNEIVIEGKNGGENEGQCKGVGQEGEWDGDKSEMKMRMIGMRVV